MVYEKALDFHVPGLKPLPLVGFLVLETGTSLPSVFGDSGKTAFFAVQNEGKKGPWGLLVQVLIP
jgi:hypothetical protein